MLFFLFTNTHGSFSNGSKFSFCKNSVNLRFQFSGACFSPYSAFCSLNTVAPGYFHRRPPRRKGVDDNSHTSAHCTTSLYFTIQDIGYTFINVDRHVHSRWRTLYDSIPTMYRSSSPRGLTLFCLPLRTPVGCARVYTRYSQHYI